MTEPSIKRQAIVVIHGIGEGRPMATTKSFTAGIVSPDYGESGFVSHPDRVSKSMELHTLRFPAQSASDETTVTDVYECYWAHRMRDTQLRHVLPWLVRLILTRPLGVRPLVLIYWIVAWLTIAVISFYTAAHFGAFKELHTTLTTGAIGVFVTAIAGWLAHRYVSGYIGDAARYLTPDVDNITQRAAIRTHARDLLVKLHESSRYDQIIVVGHSLGSVIAYDVVNRLWDEYRDRFGEALRIHDEKTHSKQALDELHERVSKVKQDRLNELENAGLELRELKGNEQEAGELRYKFQERQEALWKEQRKLKNPWLITDLITLGSPLAHFCYLARVGGDQLQRRFDAREYGMCPPLNDVWLRTVKQCDPTRRDRSIAYKPLENDWIRVIIPSAVFGLVRWTNIYFSGDVIGGPVNPVFGLGVKDVRVRRNKGSILNSKIKAMFPTSHTKYWESDKKIKKVDEMPTALSAIREAMSPK